MAYVKTAWADRVVEFAHRYKDQDLVQYTFTADPGTITDAGTLVSAALLNHIEQGIYDATYPAYIDNATSPNNARIAMSDLGVIISRNINDGNGALIINKMLGTGAIFNAQFASVDKMYVDKWGCVYSTGIGNISSLTYGYIDFLSTGISISRNVADANSALTVNQVHASSTGLILDMKFGGVQKATVDMYGNLDLGTAGFVFTKQGIAYNYPGNEGKIQIISTGITITRNIADANAVLTIDRIHASATGKLLELKTGGGTVMTVEGNGSIAAAELKNFASYLNALISMPTTGTTISRTVADANPALTVDLASASSTADIQRWWWNSVLRVSFSKEGNIVTAGLLSVTGTINGYTLGSACAAASTDFMAAGSGQFRACTDVKTAAYNIAAGDYWIQCGGTNDYDVTLPTAVGRAGQVYIVQRVVGGTNVIRVATTSSQTINGAAAPLTLSTSIWTTKMFISDGANWLQAVSF